MALKVVSKFSDGSIVVEVAEQYYLLNPAEASELLASSNSIEFFNSLPTKWLDSAKVPANKVSVVLGQRTLNSAARDVLREVDATKIAAYTNYYYGTLNSTLRTFGTLAPEQLELVRTMDKLFDEGMSTASTTYRGIRTDWRAYTVGEDLVDTAYGSTTLNRDVARKFSSSSGVLLEIQNASGVYIGGVEDELILPRNYVLRVVSITPPTADSPAIVRVQAGSLTTERVAASTTTRVVASVEHQLMIDLNTQFQVYLERIKSGEVAAIHVDIRKMDKIISSSLNGMDVPTRRRVEATIRAMNKELAAVANQVSKRVLETAEGVAELSAKSTSAAIKKLKKKGAIVTTPTNKALNSAIRAQVVQAIGKPLKEFVDSWGASAIAQVNKAVRVGYAQGLTTQDIIRRVRGTRANNFRDGILGNATQREAAAMVRTSLQHAAGVAHLQTYKDNSDIIEGYIWISTLDGRTSQECRSLDGEEFKLGKGPVPPIHVNCRSTTIPKVKGVDLLSETTRASAGGQVPAKQSYYEWLKNQPATFQDDALGTTRAALFRNGGLTAEQFSDLSLDKNFQPLTLEEMRQKNPSAFERAGI